MLPMQLAAIELLGLTDGKQFPITSKGRYLGVPSDRVQGPLCHPQQPSLGDPCFLACILCPLPGVLPTAPSPQCMAGG